ncbi:cadherin-related family member 5-like [Patiria miniata]|uniref:Uncharacterized protein n=1 Tax=Patiria miniata TaxID=46514 RepID=A0A914BME8_PATMI|nr:cadherin-related family member 5-like [Patiria miniata]
MDTRVLLLVALAAFISTAGAPPTGTPDTVGPDDVTTKTAVTEGPAIVTTQGAVTTKPPTTPAGKTSPTPNPTTAPTLAPTEATETKQPATLAPTAGKATKTPSTDSGPTKPVGPTVKPTPAPSKGGFDAASFIGGIVLGIAIVLIIGFGYSFYKTRRDKNYHTL